MFSNLQQDGVMQWDHCEADRFTITACPEVFNSSYTAATCSILQFNSNQRIKSHYSFGSL